MTSCIDTLLWLLEIIDSGTVGFTLLVSGVPPASTCTPQGVLDAPHLREGVIAAAGPTVKGTENPCAFTMPAIETVMRVTMKV